jgi:6-methylsalicylate decarboxylase
MNRFTSPTIDVHQHLWSPLLVAMLRRRTRPPRLCGWTLELSSEPDYTVDPWAHDAGARAAHAAADGVDLVLVSLPGPLGIEFLAPEEAHDLLEAYHEGALALPAPFRSWAAACLTSIDPKALERELQRGFVGLQLPATALLDGDGYEQCAPLLDLLEGTGRPLFIHPGSAAPEQRDAPAWWPAIVSYVQQMHAAWFAFRLHGRRRHPRLRVCFAMLAGLAPLHGERFATRTGQRSVLDEDVFLDVSSYGTRAVDATVRVLGIDVLVNGSDRPYGAPVSIELGTAALSALRSANPLRLIDLKEVSRAFALSSSAQA